MGKAISNKNMYNTNFEFAEFTGRWRATFDTPELKGAWTIYGGSGAGKTSFALQLAKYLTNFVDRVAYNSLEQGNNSSFNRSWRRVNMAEVKNKIYLIKERHKELRERLTKRKAPNVVIIDSVIRIDDLTRLKFNKLIDDFPNTLFIFIAHEDKAGLATPALGEYIRKQSEMKIHVEGYAAYVLNRQTGEDNEPFVIWEDGYKKYKASKEYENNE